MSILHRNSEPDPEDRDGVRRVVKTSWIYEDFFRHKLKYIIGGLILLYITYHLFAYFGGWLMLGLFLMPVWFGLLLHYLTRDYIRVLEVQLQSDEKAKGPVFQTVAYSDKTALWYFPPEKFREYRKTGKVVQLPQSDIYVAELVDMENKEIRYSQSVLSNLDFYSASSAFMKLKDLLTTYIRQNTLLKTFLNSYAEKKAARLLNEFKFRDSIVKDIPELADPNEFQEILTKVIAEKQKDAEAQKTSQEAMT